MVKRDEIYVKNGLVHLSLILLPARISILNSNPQLTFYPDSNTNTSPHLNPPLPGPLPPSLDKSINNHSKNYQGRPNLTSTRTSNSMYYKYTTFTSSFHFILCVLLSTLSIYYRTGELDDCEPWGKKRGYGYLGGETEGGLAG